MKNKKLLTLTAVVGVTLGGLSVASVASAQSYGGDPAATAAESAGTSEVEADTPNRGRIVLAQADGEASDGEQREGRRGHAGGCNLDEAAEVIGMDEAELRSAIDGGQTIAEVAVANGVDVETVIAAMVDSKAEHLAEKVGDGRITQAEADEKLAEAEGRIADQVNGLANGLADAEDA